MIIHKGHKVLAGLSVVTIDFFEPFISIPQLDRINKPFEYSFQLSPQGKIECRIQRGKAFVCVRDASITADVLVDESVIPE